MNFDTPGAHNRVPRRFVKKRKIVKIVNFGANYSNPGVFVQVKIIKKIKLPFDTTTDVAKCYTSVRPKDIEPNINPCV